MTDRLHVLFVDDDPDVLAGLRSALFRERRSWHLYMKPSGPAALELLSEQRVDVVVTDMRMPGMDGLELLRRIRQDHPEVIRIVLSGEADRKQILASLPLVHQYLCKPIQTPELKTAVERARRLRRLLQAPRLSKAAAALELAPLPDTITLVRDALHSQDVPLARVASAITADPSLTARILSVVNSSLFNPRTPVCDVDTAIKRLGLRFLHDLVTTSAVFEAVPKPRDAALERRLRSHALLVADRAAALVEPIHRGDAITAGLVHDLGRLVLAALDPEFAPENAAACADELLREEHAHFGFTHTTAGAYVLDVYGLPFDIVDAVAHHHDPPHADDPPVLAALKQAGLEVDSEGREAA